MERQRLYFVSKKHTSVTQVKMDGSLCFQLRVNHRTSQYNSTYFNLESGIKSEKLLLNLR